MELLLDHEEHENFKRLQPHLTVADTHAPFRISKSVGLPPQTMSTISNWIDEEDQYIEQSS